MLLVDNKAGPVAGISKDPYLMQCSRFLPLYDLKEFEQQDGWGRKNVGIRSVTAPLRERSAGPMKEASGICQRKEFLFILFPGRW